VTGKVIIIGDDAKRILSNAAINAKLPADMQTAVAPILAAAPSAWSAADKATIGGALSWAVQNIP
jgi:hypothetical protein